MKIALAQINTTVGDFDLNLKKVIDFITQAKKAKANLVVFPELTLTGYPPQDLLEHPDFIDRNLKTLNEAARAAEGIDMLLGYVDRNTEKHGCPLRNAVAFCRDGKVEATFFKHLLPNYDVFDEERFFEPGSEIEILKFKNGLKAGISICEDAWNDKDFWQNRRYANDPIIAQAKRGVDLFINLSASPYFVGKERLRAKMLQAMSRRYQKPFLFTNLVGGNDQLIFDGQSFSINSKGEIIAVARAFEEDLLVVDLSEIESQPVLEFSDSKEQDLQSLYDTLVLGTRDYVRKCGFKKVLIGLSGGIDSSLVALIAVDALGAENVTGVAMPSPYSSAGSVDDAKALAESLKIEFLQYPIHTVFETYRQLLPLENKQVGPDLAEENLQARIRGNILMSLSNRYGKMVLTTGNKSEIAVGYCTLYGDMCGGLAVISDVPKTQVFELCYFLQKIRQVFPPNVLTKPPSAELRPNQKDEDSLPPYAVLDPILKAYVEDHLSLKQIVEKGFDLKTVARVLRLVDLSEYKRYQMAPGIKISPKAFGMGRRYPIARKV